MGFFQRLLQLFCLLSPGRTAQEMAKEAPLENGPDQGGEKRKQVTRAEEAPRSF